MHATSPVTPPSLIPTPIVAEYAAGPSAERVQAVRDAFQRMSAVVGPEFQVFVQGSFATGTVGHDAAELDLIAAWKRPKQYHDFNFMFDLIGQRLRVSKAYKDVWREAQTMIRIEGDVTINVCPAIVPDLPGCSPQSDPLMTRVKNPSLWRTYPHTHMQKVAKRDADTAGAFVPMVRLFKRWAYEHRVGYLAQGFFLESAVFSAPDACFGAPPAHAMLLVARHICRLSYSSDVLETTAGDKDLFQPTQWEQEQFEAFRGHLEYHLPALERAVGARSSQEAGELFRAFFRRVDEAAG